MTRTTVVFACGALLCLQGCTESFVFADQPSTHEDSESQLSNATADSATLDSATLDSATLDSTTGTPTTAPETATASASETVSETATLPTDECEDKYADALVCTGFEAGLPYPTVVNNGDVQVTATQVHSGEAALYAYTLEDRMTASLVPSFTPSSAGELYSRAYYFLPEGSVPAGLVNIAEYRTALDGSVTDFNVTGDGAVDVYFHLSAGARYQSAAQVVPLGAWFCLRSRVVLSDAAGTVEVWIDDDLVLSCPASLDTLPDGGIGKLRIGVDYTEEATGITEVYVDDVVVSASPLDC